MTRPATSASLGLAASPIRQLARRLRGLLRGRAVGMVALGAVAGVASGLSVALIGTLSSELHNLLFGLHGERLSGAARLPRGYWAPVLGGLLTGILGLLWSGRRARVPVDPIEANALLGGHMSLRDSLWVTFQTLLANGFGASVGLEAGYAQTGSGLASKLGTALKLRRNDLRVLVGCGAGGAIGAAFGAPLTGAFYAFELIIGTYTVGNVAPVLVASLTGVLTSRALRAVSYAISAPAVAQLSLGDYPAVIVLALLCAGLGVAIMRSVHLMERTFELSRLPTVARAPVGGLVMTGLALITPQVLAAGHGALRADLSASLSIEALVLLIGLKILASVVSLGAGFRGGLFFASLFIGALAGKLFAATLVLLAPSYAIDPTLCILVGMGALAVAVIGGPLTMAFLVLETTGDFGVATVVLAACVVSSLTVRETFGYSFSTWRLHLRGETIRSAIDVGWTRNLTAGRMMRPDPPSIGPGASLAEFRRRFPLGSTETVVVMDDSGGYQGMALTIDAFAGVDRPDDAARTVADIARWADAALTPSMNVRDAIAAFDRGECEALAVIDDPASRKVLGLLTEGHALRRYAEELDKARQGLGGGD